MKAFLGICTAIVSLGLYFQIWFPDRAFATNRPSVVDDKDTTNTKAIQTRWLTDHNGCMRIRSLEDGYALIDKFHLKDALQDQDLKVLGEPNSIIIDSEYVNDVNGKFIRMLY